MQLYRTFLTFFISRFSKAVSNIDTKDQAPELLLVTDAVDLVLYLDL